MITDHTRLSVFTLCSPWRLPYLIYCESDAITIKAGGQLRSSVPPSCSLFIGLMTETSSRAFVHVEMTSYCLKSFNRRLKCLTYRETRLGGLQPRLLPLTAERRVSCNKRYLNSAATVPISHKHFYDCRLGLHSFFRRRYVAIKGSIGLRRL